MFWMPPNLRTTGTLQPMDGLEATGGLQITDDLQKQFIEQVLADLNQHPGIAFLQTPVVDLKDLIVDALAPPANKNGVEYDTESLHRVYLIYDEEDTKNDGIQAVAQRLFENNLDIRFPLFKKDGATDPQLVQDHWENLMHCDSVLILYGKGQRSLAACEI